MKKLKITTSIYAIDLIPIVRQTCKILFYGFIYVQEYAFKAICNTVGLAKDTDEMLIKVHSENTVQEH